MKRLAGPSALALIVALVGCPAWASERGRPLTLRECIELATRANPDIRAAGIDVEVAGQAVRIADGPFDVFLRSSLQYDRATRRDFFSEGILDLFQPGEKHGDLFTSQGVNLRVAASKLFSTGTRTTLSLAHGWDELETFVSREVAPGSLDISRGFRSVWTTDLRFTVTQSLLQGFGFDPNLASLRAAEILQDETRVLEESQVSRVVARVARAYWDLFLARRDLEIRRSSLQLAREQDRVSRLSVEAGRLPELAMFQTANVVAAREEAVVLSGAAVSDAAARLALLLDLPSATVLRPTDQPTPVLEPVSLSEVTATMKARNAQLRAARRDLDRRDQSLLAARDRVWPELDLFGTLGTTAYATLGEDQGNETYGDSWKELFDQDGLNYSAGLLFSVPLGNDAAEGDYERRRLDRKKSLVRLKQLESSLVSQVEAAARYLEANHKRIDVTRQARVYAEKRLTAEQALFDTGRATTRDILEAQDVLERARLSEARARVDLVKSRITLQDLSGELLAALGVTVR